MASAKVLVPGKRGHTMPSAIDAKCFPSNDKEFAAFVARVLAELRALILDAQPDDLAERLRSSHPAVAVHERSELGELLPNLVRTWYVYRDGSPLSEV